MVEKRQLERRYTFYHAPAFEAGGKGPLGYLFDITARGFRLISEKPFKQGKKSRFKVVLPISILNRQIVRFEAENRWCKETPNDDSYNAGFRFTEVTAETAELIAQLIAEATYSDLAFGDGFRLYE